MTIPGVRAWDTYRRGTAPQFAADGVLLLGVTMLAFTLAYLVTCPQPPAIPEADPGDAERSARVLDWRLLAACCIPLAALTYAGRGYNDARASGATTAASAGPAALFFTVLVALTAFAFLLRHGARWFLPVLAAQSLLLAAAGERTPVIVDAVILGVLLTRAGARPRRSHVHAAIAVTLLGVLAITGARVTTGRGVYQADTGPLARIEALGSGLTTGTQAGPGLLAQAAVRLDGYDLRATVEALNCPPHPAQAPSTGDVTNGKQAAYP
jgi:hypothetical protein